MTRVLKLAAVLVFSSLALLQPSLSAATTGAVEGTDRKAHV